MVPRTHRVSAGLGYSDLYVPTLQFGNPEVHCQSGALIHGWQRTL